MSRIDPKTVGMTAESRAAESVADLRYRMAIQERGTSTGGGGGTSITPGDTNTVELNLAGSTLTGLIPTTANPQVETLGLDTAATTHAVTIGTFSGQRGVYDVHGDVMNPYFGLPSSGAHIGKAGRWSVASGTAASPQTIQEPGLKVDVVRETTAAALATAGLNMEQAVNFSAATFAVRGNASDATMVTGVASGATQYSTLTTRVDACGLWGLGAIYGTGAAGAQRKVGIGAYLEGRSAASDSVVQCNALETKVTDWSASPSSHPFFGLSTRMSCVVMGTMKGNDPWKLDGSYSDSDSLGLLGGAGLILYRANGFAQFDVGLACSATNNPVRNAFIYDEGASLRSIYIKGTHATAAIQVDPGAGQLNVGAASGWDTAGVFKPGADGTNGLLLQAFSATQTAAMFGVVTEAGAPTATIYRSGFMGLGTASATSRLTLLTATTQGGGIQFGTSGTATDNAYLYRTANGTLTLEDTLVSSVAAGGQVLIGATSSPSSAKAYIKSGATTSSALAVSGIASQSVSIFGVVDSSNTELFSIGSSGSVRIMGTGGTGHLHMSQQSAAPSASTDVLRVYASADTVAGTSSSRPDNTILRSVDDLGAVRTVLASLGDGSPINGVPVNNTMAGHGTRTPVAGTIYYGAVPILQPCVLTGISIVLSTPGSANVIVALYDGNGLLVANSALAGTACSGATADNWFDVPFTATKRVNQAGTYYLAVQFDGTSSIFRAHANSATAPVQMAAGSTAGTFGTLTAVTIPTLSAGTLAPLAYTY